VVTDWMLKYARRISARISAIEATIASLFFISAAIQYNDGYLSRMALACVTAGLATCTWGFLSPGRRLWWPLAYMVLAWEFVCLLIARPSAGLAAGSWPFRVGILFCAAASFLVCITRHQRLRQVAFGAAVAGLFVTGVWFLRSTPRPEIDVWDLHQEASAALYSGSNPYQIRIRDIYPPNLSRELYGPGISVNGRLTVGFPYPPVSLLISSLGYLLAGDTRYAHLSAICAAALLLAYARPGKLSFVAPLLLLFTPRSFFMLEQNWSEMVVVFLFAAVVFCRFRFPKLAPWVTGLLIAGKQYMVFAIPALLRAWRDVPKAALAAAAVTVPFALWNLTEFLRSTVLIHLKQPFRTNALSYVALVYQYLHFQLPVWLPFLLTAAAMLFVARRGPVTTTAVCSAVSFILLVLLICNKAAFLNYYYLIIGTLAAAISSAEVETADVETADVETRVDAPR